MLLLSSLLSLARSIPLNISSELHALPFPTENVTGERRYTDEQRLLYHLLKDYEKAVRPVRNASHTVTVRLGMTMTNIFDMDERNQVLTINVWLDQEWNDELLRWNPDDFGGIQSLRIPCDLIWLPDIVLYNNADDYTAGYMRSRAMVLYTGTVFWPPPTQLRSTCKVDVSLFPFDEQKCSLKFGSWTYHGFQVDIINRSENIDLTNYVPSGEFDLVKVYQKRRVVKYTCCPEPYPDITFFIYIRRKTLYYLYNIVFPCLMMSVLTLLVFVLPPDSGEKIALGITVLLAFSVFVLAIAEKMPETSDSMPLIGIYLMVVMGMTSVSVVMTVLVLNFHHRGPFNDPVPEWARVLILERLRKLLHMKLSHTDTDSKKQKMSVCSNNMMRRLSVRVAMDDMRNEIVNEVGPDLLNGGNIVESASGEPVHLDVPQTNIAVACNGVIRKRPKTDDNLQIKLLRTLQVLIRRQESEDESERMAIEWRQIAQVIDRLLFWIFLVATVIITFILLLFIPAMHRSSHEEHPE
ncbi:hypothetical protein RB195_008069 [Necator americanus]|uniref:Cation transporter family protein n=1 Tax=Necator americanus TaxID=51031 RepID=A0ABR1C2S8_NECAM